MNMMSSFNNFYNNLSSNGLFFFWIVVFLFFFLIFLLIILVVKNKRLIKLLNERQVNSDNQNINIIEDNREEKLPVVEEIKQDINKEDITKQELKTEVKENTEKENITFEKVEIKNEENGPYKKNVLREMNTRMQTSPIHIEKNDIYEDNDDFETENNITTDVSGIDFGEDNLSPLEMMEDSYEINDSMKFAGEIVSRMEEEIKPSNIELTDYEKKQEEEAIISYDELLKVKDKIYNITEDEETDEFIDELKSFRLDLQ